MVNRIWDPIHECMDPEERRQLQLNRLKVTVARCYALQAPYRAKMDACLLYTSRCV